MRRGVHFAIRHAHERAHLGPLQQRLLDVRAGDHRHAEVVVHASSDPPVHRAWNVQVFHGLGDKGYTLNPLFLQRGRFPRVRTAVNMVLRRLRLPAHMLEPPADAGRRASRYHQVNAYGPRFHDALEEMLLDAKVSRFGHVALNDMGPITPDPEGALLWLPTWDNRPYMGGPPQSSLGPFAHEVALVSRHVPVRIKYHPLTVLNNQDANERRELEAEPGIEVAPADSDPYRLLEGVRGVLTDSSSLGFEAYLAGLPVALAKPSGARYDGIHAELAQRVPVMTSSKPDMLDWCEAPGRRGDDAWCRDLLYPPGSDANDAFADDLRGHLTAAAPE